MTGDTSVGSERADANRAENPGARGRGIACHRRARPGRRLPRSADGHPDLSGIWQALGSAHWNIEPHSAAPGPVLELGAAGAVPPGLGVIEGGEIPYRPEALAQRRRNFDDRLTLDPEIRCYLPGVPRAIYMPYPFQIIQSPEHIMFVHEYAGAVRTIYMTDHIEAPADSWMGWSNGHWDGETLAVETTGFNDKTWFDRAGNYHSPLLRVTERFTARSPDTMWYEATIEGTEVFTRPWTIRMPLYRRVEPDAELLEFRCVEFVEELIYGDVCGEFLIYRIDLRKIAVLSLRERSLR